MEEATKRIIENVMLCKNVSKPHLRSNFQKALAELIGTYIFVFLGCGSALVDRISSLTIVGIGLTWGLAMTALKYALAHVSGGYFNPAVTIAYGAVRRIPWTQVPMYVLSQLLGSTLAALTLKLLFHHQHDVLPTLTQYKSSTTDLEAIAWEFIITFILMFINCGASFDDRANKALSGLAIGITITFNVIVAGPITGASMNPGRSIGPAIVSSVYKNLWVYIVAPILGALAAVSVYSLLRSPEPPEKEKEEVSQVNLNVVSVHPQV